MYFKFQTMWPFWKGTAQSWRLHSGQEVNKLFLLVVLKWVSKVAKVFNSRIYIPHLEYGLTSEGWLPSEVLYKVWTGIIEYVKIFQLFPKLVVFGIFFTAKRNCVHSMGNGRSVCTVLVLLHLMLTKKMTRRIQKIRKTIRRYIAYIITLH